VAAARDYLQGQIARAQALGGGWRLFVP